MRVDSIVIHIGKPDFEFQVIRRLEARCEASASHKATPTMDEVNAKLREMAAGQDADAVIDVHYSSEMTATSVKLMTATGLAVRRLSEEVPCSNCNETIKRTATQCSHCGHTLTEPGSLEAIQKRVAMFTPTPPLVAIPRPARPRSTGSARALMMVLAVAGTAAAFARAIFRPAK
jgi:hypothetical protein